MHRGDGGAAYDPNGNMVLRVECRGEPSCSPITYQQEFDAENRLAVVTNTVTGQVVRFVYDGDGNRILRIGSEGTTVYIGDYYEQTGSAIRKYYYAGGQRIAVRVNGALYFLHTDHLGSATLTTDASGNRVGELHYTPYGITRYEWGSMLTNRRYTGQRWDSALGLYDYRARYYHPVLGRFISADPIVSSPGHPQALNRYAYMYNNPLRFTDPSGHCPWCIAIGVGAIVGAGVTYGFQVAAHISQNGSNIQAFTNVNWAAVGAGAVAGAVGVATFGMGTAVFGTGLAGTVAAGAISGVVAGQAARATENVLSGREITAGLGDPAQIAADAALGGAFAGAGYGIGRLVRPAVAEAAGSLEPPQLRTGRLNHQRLGQAYLENVPVEQRPFVDVDQTFTDLAGRRFRPDVVNHITGEIVEYKPRTWMMNPEL